MQHNGLSDQNIASSSEGGQRIPLCCNNWSARCPPFDIKNSFVSEQDALRYLADILVESFLEYKRNETKQKSDSLLPDSLQG